MPRLQSQQDKLCAAGCPAPEVACIIPCLRVVIDTWVLSHTGALSHKSNENHFVERAWCAICFRFSFYTTLSNSLQAIVTIPSSGALFC